MTIYAIGNVDDSGSVEVSVTEPDETLYAQLVPTAGVVPVTHAITTELDWMYGSVMTHVLLLAPHVPVFTTFTASGGREDCGD